MSEYVPKGGALELFCARDPEILLEGPAGTGKTRAVLEYCDLIARCAPTRQLWVRRTRKSLTESVLVTFENKVLGPGHPITRGPTRAHRHSYVYPGTRSEIILGGMDNIADVMSTEYDIICGFEGTQLTGEQWEYLSTRNRNLALNYQQMILDCNPGPPGHWANRRAKAGLMRRILSRHRDNPAISPAYLDTLGRLTGSRRARLLEGRWAMEEGLIYDVYDPEINGFDACNLPHIAWTLGSFDWGHTKPGCLQIWGVTRDEDMYRLAEVYRRGESLDWWTEVLHELNQEYDLTTAVADDAEPRSIDHVNKRLSTHFGRKGQGLVRAAEKGSVRTGIDLCRWAMRPNPRDLRVKPKLYLVRDSFPRGLDPALVEEKVATCLEDELESYAWLLGDGDKFVAEKPDPRFPNHACDSMRYAAIFAWRKNLERVVKERVYESGAVGDVLKFAEVFRGRMRA